MKDPADSIAIVGIGCRLPGGASDPSTFWEHLAQGKDAITEIPADRSQFKGLYSDVPKTPGTIASQKGGFIGQHIAEFDANYFGISPREANSMDPQQRLLLEVAQEAIEDAGILPEELKGSKTGVYVGSFNNDYEMLMYYNLKKTDLYAIIGGGRYSTPSRVSFFFDFRGPSIQLDTACSSSIVALHTACENLKKGIGEVALVGGCNLLINPWLNIGLSYSGILSPSGRCNFGDASADGYIRGDSVCMVALKTLSAAQRDNNRIYGLISATGTNHDGGSSDLLLKPGAETQAALLHEVWEKTAATSTDFQYVEAHGTGTAIGDPIELEALGQAFKDRALNDPVAIGSVKTNVGHSEGASGMASVIKIALSLQKQQIPPSLHFNTPNPNIPWSELPFKVNTTLSEWPAGESGKPRMAALNSFGMTGTNASVVFSEAPVIENSRQHPDRMHHVLALSAKSTASIEARKSQFIQFLQDTKRDESLADICYTAGARRAHHAHRIAVTGATKAEMVAALESATPRVVHEKHKLIFVYSGQGSQWWGMGQELMQTEDVFAKTMKEFDSYFSVIAGWSVLEALQQSKENSEVGSTRMAQPAIVAIQIALTELFRFYGVEPDALIGHSLGEVTVAYVSGSLTMQEVATVIYHRGRLMQEAHENGKMAEISRPEGEVRALLAANPQFSLDVAAINSPSSAVVSGITSEVEELVAMVETNGGTARMLRVNYAFHSRQMSPIADQLEHELKGITPKVQNIPVYSTVMANELPQQGFTAAYWSSNVKQAVQFSTTIQKAAQAGPTIFVEIGSHPVLTISMLSSLESLPSGTTHEVLSTLSRESNEDNDFASTLSRLYCLGLDLDFGKLYHDRLNVALPVYPFDRKQYWITPSKSQSVNKKVGLHPLLGSKLSLAKDTIIFENWLDADELKYTHDHKVFGDIVVPGAAMLEMAMSAGRSALGAGQFQVSDFQLEKPLKLEQGTEKRVQTILEPNQNGFEVSVSSFQPAEESQEEGSWVRHSSCVLLKENADAINTRQLQHHFQQEINIPAHYEAAEKRGLYYGPAFQRLSSLKVNDNEGVAQLSNAETKRSDSQGYWLHPTVLDACFQAFDAMIPQEWRSEGTFLPVGLEKLSAIEFQFNPQLSCLVSMHDRSGLPANTAKADITLCNEAGDALVKIEGMTFKQVNLEVFRDHGSKPLSDYLFEVKWIEQPIAEKHPIKETAVLLVFGEDTDDQHALFETLLKGGQTIVNIQKGRHFEKYSATSFQLNAADPANYLELFKEVKHEYPATEIHAIHAWGFSSGQDALPQSGTELLNFQESGTGVLLHIVQALEKMQWLDAVSLTVLSRGTQTVDEEPSSILNASMASMAKVAASEYPELKLKCIDFPLEKDAKESTFLTMELEDGSSAPQVAYRQGQRYVPRLSKVENWPAKAEPIALTKESTWLITGGMGGLGYTAAEWLAGQGIQHIALLGRSELKGSDTEAKIEVLKRNGIQVSYHSVDVSNLDALQALFDSIAEHHPPLKGVIHTAGVLDDGPLNEQNWQRFSHVMSPKLAGAWNLHLCTQNLELEHFILYSSVASVFGLPSQSNYAAANAFLDALAHHRHASGLPGTTVNWGPWAEVGMAARVEEKLQERLGRIGFEHVAPATAMELLGSILSSDYHQVVAANMNFSAFLGSGLGDSPLFEWMRKAAESGQTSASDFRETMLQLPAENRMQSVMDFVSGIVSGVLGFEPTDIDVHKGLFDHGLDSLTALEVRNRMQNTLKVALPSTLLFKYPTVTEISHYLLDEVLLMNEPETTANSPDSTSDSLDEVDELDEDDLEAMLKLTFSKK